MAVEQVVERAVMEAHRGVADASDVQDAVERLRQVLDIHIVYHLAQCPDRGIDAPFVKATYPPAWIGHYIVNNYVTVDPVCQEGFKRMLPFDWAELTPTEAGLHIFEEAVKMGLGGSGYSIPIVDQTGRRALFSVNAPLIGAQWEHFVEQHRDLLLDLAHAVHRRALSEVFGDEVGASKLTPREIEILQWAALGKEAPMIAGILGLTANTVRGYIKSARYKLNAATMGQAIAKAAQMRLISLNETTLNRRGPTSVQSPPNTTA